MTAITIYVSRNGNSNQLKLRDSENHNPGNDNLTTDVDVDDTVTWELDTNSGLYSIEEVKQVTPSDRSYNPASVNLMRIPPTKANGFKGTIVSTSPGPNKFEQYKIGFKITQNSPTLWDDPKLKIKPGS